MLFVKSMKLFLTDLPSPVNLNSMYNFGSLLGVIYVIQVVSGLLLSLVYFVDLSGGYYSIVSIMKDLSGGWIVRFLHSVGASVLFIFIYLHIFRGVLYSGVKMRLVWLSGLTIMMILMGVAFMGYVLPWGQMSYWGMTVVTSMLGAFPLVGSLVTGILWGSLNAGVVSLSRFFSLHYLASLLMGVFIVLHLIVLHNKGSSNPIGVFSGSDKIFFDPSYSFKDSLGFVVLFLIYWVGVFYLAYVLMDETNFEEVNYMKTPSHIKPEWYFLFAYCILRSVESKLGGVILMLMAVAILGVFSVVKVGLSGSLVYFRVMKIIILVFSVSFIMLVYLGGLSVEYPYSILSKVFTNLYFLSVVCMSLVHLLF